MSRGRMSLDVLAGHVIALVASLDHEMAALTADGIADRLGVSDKLAEQLLAALRAPSDEGTLGYPTYDDEQGRTVLPYLTSLHGRALRLSEAESAALSAALSAAGVAENSSLREKVAGGFMAPGFDQELIDRIYAASGTTKRGSRALVCTEAAQKGRRLSFDYPTHDGSSLAKRTVDPIALRTMSGRWYLDGFDVDRDAVRTFALDKMGDPEMVGPAQDHGDVAALGHPDARTVRLSFASDYYLTLFEWPGLRLLGEAGDGAIEAEIDYWGGTWLPRRIAACGGDVRCDDADVMARARAHAQESLGC